MQRNQNLPELPNPHEVRHQLFKEAEVMLYDLVLKMTGMGMEDAEAIINRAHTELAAIRIAEETIFAVQTRRVPHGTIPDQPISHPLSA